MKKIGVLKNLKIEDAFYRDNPVDGQIMTYDGVIYNFVHERIFSRNKHFSDGSTVTFEVETNEHKIKVSDIRLFSSETYSFIVRNFDCVQSEFDKREAINNLPDYLLEDNKDLRSYLPIDRFFTIINQILCKEISSETKVELLKETLDFIRNIPSEDSMIFLDFFPDEILKQHNEFRKYLSDERILNIFLQMAEELTDDFTVLSLQEEIADYLEIKRYSQDNFLDLLPSNYLNNKRLRRKFSIKRYLDLIVPIFNTSPKDIRPSILSEIKDKIIIDFAPKSLSDGKALENCSNDPKFLSDLPRPATPDNYWIHFQFELLREDIIWKIVPPEIKIHRLIKNTSNLDEIDCLEIKDIIENSILSLTLLDLVPDYLFTKSVDLFLILYPRKQIELIFDHETGVEKLWPLLNDFSRLLLIYRCAKENRDLSFAFSDSADIGANVKFALLLVWARLNPDRKDQAFQKGHTILIEYLINNALDLSKSVSMWLFLPSCQGYTDACNFGCWGPVYCDVLGRPTKTKSIWDPRRLDFKKVDVIYCKYDGIYCRMYEEDAVIPTPNYWDDNDNSIPYGARNSADLNLKWSNWTILELLEYAQVKPKIKEIQKPEEYVPRLSGWLNRLLEIRDKLNCSVCNTPLVSNNKYKQNYYKYNVITASCPNGEGHDSKILLTHCWACGKLVDSRESKININGHFLCIHCGAGSKKTEQFRLHSDLILNLSFKIGELCPKCESSKIAITSYGSLICGNCSHFFHPPRDKKILEKYLKKNLPIYPDFTQKPEPGTIITGDDIPF